MIAAITAFYLPATWFLGEDTRIFPRAAPKYRGISALIHQNCLFCRDDATSGGVYF